MNPTDSTFELYDKPQDFFTSIAAKTFSPYQYWLGNNVKNVLLKVNFFRPSQYGFKTNENDPSFLSTYEEATHHTKCTIM